MWVSADCRIGLHGSMLLDMRHLFTRLSAILHPKWARKKLILALTGALNIACAVTGLHTHDMFSFLNLTPCPCLKHKF